MNRKIYREFRDDMSTLDTVELRTLEGLLDGDDGFRKEAGQEFSRAVHNARDDRMFREAA